MYSEAAMDNAVSILHALSAMIYYLHFICYALSAMLYLLRFICYALSAVGRPSLRFVYQKLKLINYF